MHLDNVLSAQSKLYILEKPISRPKSNSPEEESAQYFKYLADESDVMSILIFSISPEFSGGLRDKSCHEVVKDIENQLGFYKHTGKLLIMKEILSLKLKKNQSIKDHLINIRRLFKCLTRLGYKMAQEELMHLMWYSLPKEICGTASAYMKEPRKDVAILHEDILASLEPKPAPAELMDTDWIDELGDLSCPECGSQDICEHSINIDQIEIGLPDAPSIFMIDCLITSYESWVIDTGSGNHICNHLQGFTRRETLRKDRSNLRVGEGTPLIAEAVGSYSLSLPSGVVLELENCYYVPKMIKNVMSFDLLVDQGFHYKYDYKMLSVFKNNIFYFKATPVNGLYTVNLQDDNKEIYHISLGGRGMEKYEKWRENVKNAQSQHSSNLASAKFRIWRRQTNLAPPDSTKLKTRYTTRYGAIDDVSLNTTSVILGTCARNSSTYTEQSANKGCEVYVKRPTSEKLKPKSDKCFFVGYLKTTVGYYFYNPEENKVFVARNGKFLEEKFLSSGNTREDVDVQVVDEENIAPIVEPEIQHENVEPQSEPIEEVQTQDLRRSNRERQEPDRYLGFLVSQDGGDLNEPTSYGEAVSGSESEQWQEAMKAEMQSMYDNQVWGLTDLPQHCRAVGRKWVFKKKTDMDGNVHTFKARLVTKGFTQTHGIDYDETFLADRTARPIAGKAWPREIQHRAAPQLVVAAPAADRKTTRPRHQLGGGGRNPTIPRNHRGRTTRLVVAAPFAQNLSHQCGGDGFFSIKQTVAIDNRGRQLKSPAAQQLVVAAVAGGDRNGGDGIIRPSPAAIVATPRRRLPWPDHIDAKPNHQRGGGGDFIITKPNHQRGGGGEYTITAVLGQRRRWRC
ncbi:hypothetical protein OSB04_003446 [Centaurea solstitialis]|uniref:Reverse transcriptase Ty1/copia-type domain-containing protein n=1 Tax=Centaurea solstitialis TaxID=347529 RepID=A0AA38TUW0_9ASTR|nr:hypothetical protein OSB04_003446 [Centaurea solstitialis]